MSSARVDVPPSAESVLRPVGHDDRYFDYCLQPYQPRRPPQGKLRGETLLVHALRQMGCLEAFAEPMAALQRALGRDMTVWGLKYDGDALWWEIYVYDPRKDAPAATLGALTRTLAPWIELRPRIEETVPYMMVSVELSPEVLESGVVSEVDVYLTGTPEHEGRSYRVTQQGRELVNTYRFLEPKRDVDRLVSLLRSSAFVDYGDPRVLARVLLPQLFACKRVCVAKKRRRDGIYYSGIAVDQLLWFLRTLGWPRTLAAFVEEHRDLFDHLYFDVGLDYEQRSDGRIIYTKSSFYGTF